MDAVLDDPRRTASSVARTSIEVGSEEAGTAQRQMASFKSPTLLLIPRTIPIACWSEPRFVVGHSGSLFPWHARGHVEVNFGNRRRGSFWQQNCVPVEARNWSEDNPTAAV